MRVRASLAILSVLVLSHFSGASLAQPHAGSWRREPDMLTARAAHALVATRDALFVLAGTGQDGKPVLDVERFDGRTWTRESTLPGEGVNAPAAVAIDDTIYLIGGFGTTSNRPTAAVWRYNIRTRTWTEAAPLPAPRGGHAAVVMNGRIRVIGGGNAVSTLATHSVYDPRADSWTEATSLPRSLGSPAAVVMRNMLFSIGGRSGPGDFGDVYAYDESTATWTSGIAIDPRGTGGAAVIGSSIYYVGGESQAKGTVLADVLRLDAGAKNWIADAPMPTARNFARAAMFKGRMYVVGGSTTYGRSHDSMGSGVVESFAK